MFELTQTIQSPNVARVFLYSLSRLARCRRGATAIEFAMISPVLMLLAMGVMELGMLLTAQMLLETATFSASRLGKTGHVATDMTQEETITAEIGRIGRLLMVANDIEITTLSYAEFENVGEPEPFQDTNSNGARDAGEPFTDVNGNGTFDRDQGGAGFGDAEEIVVYTTSYDWKLFTPLLSRLIGADGKVELSARAVVKNEPYL